VTVSAGVRIFLLLLVSSMTVPARADQIAFLTFTDGVWQVAVTSPSRNSARVVSRFSADATRVSCLPDSGALLVTLNDGSVGMLSTDTGTFSTLSALPRPVLDAAASPDGNSIAFSYARAGGIDTNDIYLARRDGTGIRRLTSMDALQHEPAWSQDGTWVYFASGDGGSVHDLWRVRANGEALEQITVASRYNFDVAVGPNEVLAYSSNRSGDYEIYMSGANAPAKRLTYHQGLDARPTFDQSGSRIAFERVVDGVPNIWVARVRDGRVRQLTQTLLGARGPVWCK
jgi:Tol biopolymer transport system component